MQWSCLETVQDGRCPSKSVGCFTEFLFAGLWRRIRQRREAEMAIAAPNRIGDKGNERVGS
jgi:hypothetical protein